MPWLRWSLVLDIGAEGPLLAHAQTRTVTDLLGFGPAEQAQDGSARMFRWTTEEVATLTFPAAQRMQPLLLNLTLCGCRFDAHTTVTPVQVTVNGVWGATLNATDQWQHAVLALPPDMPHADASVQIALHAPLRTTAEGRQLGIALDQIALRQVQPVALPTRSAAR